MPIDQIVTMLIAERERIQKAIEALQGPMKRRGRPPKNAGAAVAAPSSPAPAMKRNKRTAAQRKAQAERMKAYWAAKKKAAK